MKFLKTKKNTDLWDLADFVCPLIQRSNPCQHALYSSDVWVNSILTYFLEGKRECSKPKLIFNIKVTGLVNFTNYILSTYKYKS